MVIPFIDLRTTNALIREDVLNSWKEVFDKQEYVGGPAVAELERLLRQELATENALACANGTDAILIGLQAMGVKAGDYVALPNLTFWATYEAIAQLGAIPVLIDCDPETLQIDFAELKKAFERFRFKYAVIVHLMGWASPYLKEIRGFCVSHEIGLLEDGAQSYGVTIQDESVYSQAQIATLSFYPAKVLGGCMDGGAIVGQNGDWLKRARVLCNHGRAAHYSYEEIGWNSRMGGLQATFLVHFIKKMDRILESRRWAFHRYLEIVDNNSPKYTVYREPCGVKGNGYLSVFSLTDITPIHLAERLKSRGVSIGRVYPETMDQQSPAKNAPRVSDLVHSRQFCRQVINLPLYYGMTDQQISVVTAAWFDSLKELS